MISYMLLLHLCSVAYVVHCFRTAVTIVVTDDDGEVVAAGRTSRTAGGRTRRRRAADRRPVRVRRDEFGAAVARRDDMVGQQQSNDVGLGEMMMRGDDERDLELRDLGTNNDELAGRRNTESRDVDYDYIFGDNNDDINDDVDDQLVSTNTNTPFTRESIHEANTKHA